MKGSQKAILATVWWLGWSVIPALGQSLTITTKELRIATVGHPYEETLEATGGRPPYEWWWMGMLPDGLTLNASYGQIRGTPTRAGVFVFRVSVRDSRSEITSKEFTLTVNPPLQITSPRRLPAATVRIEYRFALTATGGAPPYLWGLFSWPAVPGLQLNRNTGLLSGTPTQPGDFVFSVQVEDRLGLLAKETLQLTVIPCPLAIKTTSPLAAAVVGTGYNLRLEAECGLPPYRWSLDSGALPRGLILDGSAGTLAGRPEVAGTFQFVLKVEDNAGGAATRSFALTVVEPLEILTACPLLPATATTAYSLTLSAKGGTTPYTWSLDAGSLPTGLQLASSTGRITGTASTAGQSSFTLRVRDARGLVATKPCSMWVDLLVQPSSIPKGTVGSAYRQQFSAAGGSGSYRWSLTEGVLPPGLNLDEATGVVAGTPQAWGIYKFSLAATDQDRPVSGRSSYELTVDLPALPALVLEGLPDPLPPLQQPAIGLRLASAYPVALTGQLLVSFRSDAIILGDNPQLQFRDGGRSAEFKIDRGLTRAVFKDATATMLQTGTVAGAVTFTVRLWAPCATGLCEIPSSPIPVRSTQISRLPPEVFGSITVTRGSERITVTITAYSTTRQVTAATFAFTVASGFQLSNTTFTIDTLDVSNAWFRSAQSNERYGGLFVYEQTFGVNNPEGVNSVAVTLRNTVGASQTVRQAF